MIDLVNNIGMSLDEAVAMRMLSPNDVERMEENINVSVNSNWLLESTISE